MSLPTVTIIVLNYNGLRHLEECFASLTGLDYPADRLELMLVDNASADGSVAFVQERFPGVRVVETGGNLGFAGGNNRGAEAATGEYIVFLNNDMRVDAGFVHGLLEAVQSDPEAVCAGAKILNWDGTRFDFTGSTGDFAAHAYQLGLGQPYRPQLHNEIVPLLYACGGAMLIQRAVFLEAGGFDEDYFMYYEDLDLGWRLWLLGHKVLFAPKAVATHKHHGSISRVPDAERWLAFFQKRNSLFTILKNYDDSHLGPVMATVLAATVDGVVNDSIAAGELNPDYFRNFGAAPAAGQATIAHPQRLGALVAVQAVMDQMPRVLDKRHFIQSRRKRTDAEMAALFQWPFRYWPDAKVRTQYLAAEPFGLQGLFEGVPRRVLVVSSDILPYPGMPTVGSGLRAWGIGQGLRAKGHNVVFAMPQAALKGREALAGEEAKRYAWEPETLHEIVRQAEPDIVVVCNWPVLDNMRVEGLDVPIVLDQHGPHYLEREYNRFGQADDNANRKINALRKADFFTCAGKKQLGYFQQWLERAGWSERERAERSAAIPVSLSPELPPRSPNDELSFVYGGVFLPWQDPSRGLLALVKTLNSQKRGKLYFYGGKHPVYDVDSGIFDQLLQQLQESPHVVAPGMVSHDALIERYTSAHVAVDLMKRNPERELAFTTRTVEYLWCGLPVIYHNYAELSDYIREYEAGWVLDPEDGAALEQVLAQIFSDPAEVARRSANAQRLVRECLTWDRTIAPLDTFVRRPKVRRREAARAPGVAPAEPRPTPRVLPTGNAKWSYLISELQRHYRRGGLRVMMTEAVDFLRRQL